MNIDHLIRAGHAAVDVISQGLPGHVGKRRDLDHADAAVTQRACFDLPGARQFCRIDNRLARRFCSLGDLNRNVFLARAVAPRARNTQNVICFIVSIAVARLGLRFEEGGMALKTAWWDGTAKI
jgi:hypothetical protein